MKCRVRALCIAALFAPSPVLAAESSFLRPWSGHSWQGFYAGLQGGHGWTKASALGDSETFRGWLFGGHAGVNFQYGPVVAGIEADVSRAWNTNRYEALGAAFRAGTDWQGSLRGRIGFAYNRGFIYGTGGFAVTRARISGPGLRESDTLKGWTVGIGIEDLYADPISIRIEYRYSDYGELRLFGVGTGIDVTEHTVLIGASYRF